MQGEQPEKSRTPSGQRPEFRTYCPMISHPNARAEVGEFIKKLELDLSLAEAEMHAAIEEHDEPFEIEYRRQRAFIRGQLDVLHAWLDAMSRAHLG